MAAAMAAECVVLVVVRTVVVVCVVVCEQHLVCELGGQVSEARVVRTFLANDAAYLTLLGAVTQLRRSEIVTLGVGLPVVVLCGVFSESWVSADCPFLRIKTQHITSPSALRATSVQLVEGAPSAQRDATLFALRWTRVNHRRAQRVEGGPGLALPPPAACQSE